MGDALRKALLKSEQKPDEIHEAIREVCARLDMVNRRFEMESDSDLIEACIYEMESLRARYRYLLRTRQKSGSQSGRASLLPGRGRNMSLGCRYLSMRWESWWWLRWESP